MHVDPIDPPTRAAPTTTSAPTRAVVTTVSGGRADVRLVSSRGAKQRVPIVAGLTLARGDRVLLDHIDGDRNLPIITAKLTAGTYA